MYLSDFCRFLLCTCGWERRGERGAGEGEGARERGIVTINVPYIYMGRHEVVLRGEYP